MKTHRKILLVVSVVMALAAMGAALASASVRQSLAGVAGAGEHSVAGTSSQQGGLESAAVETRVRPTGAANSHGTVAATSDPSTDSSATPDADQPDQNAAAKDDQGDNSQGDNSQGDTVDTSQDDQGDSSQVDQADSGQSDTVDISQDDQGDNSQVDGGQND